MDGNRPRSAWWNTWQGWMLGIAVYVALSGILTSATSCALLPRRERPSSVNRHAWKRDEGPVVPHDNFPTDCSLCHEQGNWHTLRADFQFDHGAETGVVLVGAHAQAKCLRCHNDRGPVTVFSKRGCAGCHQDYHRGQLGKACAQCHNECNWIPEGQIAGHNRTRFPLVGAHLGVACFRCHPGAQVGNFLRAPVACEACHQDDLRRTRDPDHVAAGFTANCQRCHTPIDWNIAMFSHAGITDNCSNCHLAEFNATTSPNHVANGFPMTCERCHSTTAWRPATRRPR